MYLSPQGFQGQFIGPHLMQNIPCKPTRTQVVEVITTGYGQFAAERFTPHISLWEVSPLGQAGRFASDTMEIKEYIFIIPTSIYAKNYFHQSNFYLSNELFSPIQLLFKQ